jgi:hypothetical protein
MSRRGKIAVGAGALFLAVGSFVIWRTLTAESPELSRATSPDGTWSVAVEGNRQLSGSYEIVVKIYDAQGQVVPNGSFVVGMAGNRADAERDYAVTFEGNEVARVGKVRTIEKSKYFR